MLCEKIAHWLPWRKPHLDLGIKSANGGYAFEERLSRFE